jgi:rubrerythrin
MNDDDSMLEEFNIGPAPRALDCFICPKCKEAPPEGFIFHTKPSYGFECPLCHHINLI